MTLWSAYVLSHLTYGSNILILSKRVIHKKSPLSRSHWAVGPILGYIAWISEAAQAS